MRAAPPTDVHLDQGCGAGPHILGLQSAFLALGVCISDPQAQLDTGPSLGLFRKSAQCHGKSMALHSGYVAANGAGCARLTVKEEQ